MKKAAVLAVLLLLGISSGVAISQTKTPGIDLRERNQRARIREGVRTGQLTRHEARRLRARERRIRGEKMMAKAHGKLTGAERRHLRRELRRASARIHRLKHNFRHRHV